ncbi:conserved hypothetical protein [Ricinus communis]|uniref:Uncharacterized protein n=1 Tax=Ricinus communis TaxID=3988 RepID=B9SM45_RICCO|nr:conserved hypothetical protein [Ricinus communis]
MENLIAMMQQQAKVLQALTIQCQTVKVAPTTAKIPLDNGTIGGAGTRLY